MNKHFRAFTAFITVAILALNFQTASAAGAPHISAVQANNISSSSVQIHWTTDVATDSLIQYSTSNPVPANASQIFSGSLVTSHDFGLIDLTPNTQYYFALKSCVRKNSCVTATGNLRTLGLDSTATCNQPTPITGSWSKVESPSVDSGAVTVNNHLRGIATISRNDIWSVGWATDPNGPQYLEKTLIEHFDGNSWSIVPSPNTTDQKNQLYSVSAVSSSDVWAVGHTENTSTFPSKTLIEHWDGSAWNIIPSPNFGSVSNELRSVTAISSSDVWAVGWYSGFGKSQSLILHWNGSNWSQVVSPNPNAATANNQFSGITAISANDIWAVGFTGNKGSFFQPLVAHWNGSSWTQGYAPNQFSWWIGSAFNSISAVSANDIWAVGYSDFNNGFGTTTNMLLQHWNGQQWTVACPAQFAPGSYQSTFRPLYGVSAVSSSDVWAVGENGGTPMIFHWDGKAWLNVQPANFTTSYNTLWSVTATGVGVWSSGEYSAGNGLRTLIERYLP